MSVGELIGIVFAPTWWDEPMETWYLLIYVSSMGHVCRKRSMVICRKRRPMVKIGLGESKHRWWPGGCVLRMEADRWAKIHKVLMWVGS
jgi:hypothetical protein